VALATARHHVGVADRLDLLDTLRIGEPVERGENLIQEGHQLLRGPAQPPVGLLTRRAEVAP
jgi:hypothetical protein